MDEVFTRIRSAVESELSCSAHNMDHVDRVYNLCLNLAEGLDVDLDVLRAAALLHDIARIREDDDPSGRTDHALVGAGMAARILNDIGFPEEKIEHVRECIVSHRFRTGNGPQSLEARILFDADKLDIVGAIGIARGFVWVGRNNARIYSKPDIEAYARENLEGGKLNGRIKDKTKHSWQIEWEIKTKHIIDKLHTEKAKEMCRERRDFVKSFLDRLEKEVRGDL